MTMVVVMSSVGGALADSDKIKQPPPEVRTLVTGSNAFALELYAKLAGREGNLFFSPASIHTALGMTYVGARGRTAEQMAKVFHFDLPPEKLHPAFGRMIEDLNAGAGKDKYELSVANALWAQKGYPFLDDFITVNETHYGAGLFEVDFRGDTEGARKRINDWVSQKTRKRIRDLLAKGTIRPLTRLVLTNAIYFKGQWALKFDPKRTRNAWFSVSPTKQSSVAMMNRTDRFGYMETPDFQALQIPYAGNDLSMVVFLPKSKTGLKAFEKTLTAKNLTKWLERPKLRRQKVVVSVPKFKLTSRFELADVLAKMGMPDAFSREADFSGMDGSRDLSISAVVHKAFVEVNEEGTEAAGATGVVFGLTAVRERPPVFKADHRFVFMIRHDPTGNVLFLGRVVDPKN